MERHLIESSNTHGIFDFRVTNTTINTQALACYPFNIARPYSFKHEELKARM